MSKMTGLLKKCTIDKSHTHTHTLYGVLYYLSIMSRITHVITSYAHVIISHISISDPRILFIDCMSHYLSKYVTLFSGSMLVKDNKYNYKARYIVCLYIYIYIIHMCSYTNICTLASTILKTSYNYHGIIFIHSMHQLTGEF